MDVAPGHAAYVFPYKALPINFFEPGNKWTVSIGARDVTFTMDRQLNGAVADYQGDAYTLLVTNDEDYRKWMADVPDAQKIVVYGFELADWKHTAGAVEKVKQAIPEDKRRELSSRVDTYLQGRQSTALTLFIGVFVSLLFFIASGSMLYFKLFTELQDDYVQYKSLMRMGMSVEEVRRVINVQIGLLFAIPVVVGSLHAAFAYKALANLLMSNLWAYGLVVVGVFAVMQGVYFLLTRQAYMKQMGNL
ncbi:hypothetical protein LJK88_01170 [Paenibacillus sp. P26]|nr:hypothetical protein LJK88_01170 [Paenibacillus sp. P26]